MDLTEIWISEAPFYDFNAKCAADGVRSFDGAVVEVGSAQSAISVCATVPRYMPNRTPASSVTALFPFPRRPQRSAAR